MSCHDIAILHVSTTFSTLDDQSESCPCKILLRHAIFSLVMLGLLSFSYKYSSMTFALGIAVCSYLFCFIPMIAIVALGGGGARFDEYS